MPEKGWTMFGDNFWTWLNYIGHSLSGTAILGTIIGWFPPVAAGVAACWYFIQMYESRTVQRYLHRRRQLKIAKLQAAIKVLEEAQAFTRKDFEDDNA